MVKSVCMRWATAVHDPERLIPDDSTELPSKAHDSRQHEHGPLSGCQGRGFAASKLQSNRLKRWYVRL